MEVDDMPPLENHCSSTSNWIHHPNGFPVKRRKATAVDDGQALESLGLQVCNVWSAEVEKGRFGHTKPYK